MFTSNYQHTDLWVENILVVTRLFMPILQCISMLQNNLEKYWKVTRSPSCKEVFYMLRIESNI